MYFIPNNTNVPSQMFSMARERAREQALKRHQRLVSLVSFGHLYVPVPLTRPERERTSLPFSKSAIGKGN